MKILLCQGIYSIYNNYLLLPRLRHFAHPTAPKRRSKFSCLYSVAPTLNGPPPPSLPQPQLLSSRAPCPPRACLLPSLWGRPCAKYGYNFFLDRARDERVTEAGEDEGTAQSPRLCLDINMHIA